MRHIASQDSGALLIRTPSKLKGMRVMVDLTSMNILRWREVAQIVGCFRMTIARIEKAGTFPQRIRIRNGSVGWLKHEVEDRLDVDGNDAEKLLTLAIQTEATARGPFALRRLGVLAPRKRAPRAFVVPFRMMRGRPGRLAMFW